MPELPVGVRPAIPDDISVIAELIGELAAYEREPDAARATDDALHTSLFGDDRVAHCLMAEHEGETVGMALWYRTFSTWTGTCGIHLEDLFVHPGARGTGLGRRLMTALARTAEINDWERLEWQVLDWNEPSIAFYDRLGGQPQTDWITYRLSGDVLTSVARLD